MRRFTPRRIRCADDVTPELPTSSCIRQPSRFTLSQGEPYRPCGGRQCQQSIPVQLIALDIATPHLSGAGSLDSWPPDPVIKLKTAALHRGWGSASIAHTRHQQEEKDRLFLLGPPMGLLNLGPEQRISGRLIFGKTDCVG
jgi:hypothetical protein